MVSFACLSQTILSNRPRGGKAAYGSGLSPVLEMATEPSRGLARLSTQKIDSDIVRARAIRRTTVFGHFPSMVFHPSIFVIRVLGPIWNIGREHGIKFIGCFVIIGLFKCIAHRGKHSLNRSLDSGFCRPYALTIPTAGCLARLEYTL